MTKIKLCGLSRLADIEAVNAARPDYIGFVFAEQAVIDKNCAHIDASFVEQNGEHGRINATRNTANNLFVANAGTDFGN